MEQTDFKNRTNGMSALTLPIPRQESKTQELVQFHSKEIQNEHKNCPVVKFLAH